jgi:hypothetical protein
MTAAAATLHGEYTFDSPNGVGFMPELNDPEWGLCDHGPYLPADYRDDEEYYDGERDEAGEPDAYGEWDGYDDEAEVEALARLAARIEPGRATVAQWAQAIRRLGTQRRSRAALSPAHPLSKT